VQRQVERSELQATYGLSDTHVLVLGLPYVRVAQRSTLSTDSADPAAQAEVDRLATRTVSGAGRLHLASLHRIVFSDRHGFLWGYGLDWPLENPKSPWDGRGTLQVDPPFRRGFLMLHYTFYPYLTDGHLDFRAEAGASETARLKLAQGGTGAVHAGNELTASLGWQQNVGPFTGAIGTGLRRQGETQIDASKQGDGVAATYLSAMLGYGNLDDLARGPVGLPYQFQLSYERTVRGFNFPILSELRLNLQLYF
jgi:hypothetical protein